MQEVFKEGIEDKCKLGAEYVSATLTSKDLVSDTSLQAAENAVQLVDDFAGSTHWATYRASEFIMLQVK